MRGSKPNNSTVPKNWNELDRLERKRRSSAARSATRCSKVDYRIIEKLENLGWGSEIQQIPHDNDLGGHRLVKQPTRLTERSL
jgi:hypothetical protein